MFDWCVCHGVRGRGAPTIYAEEPLWIIRMFLTQAKMDLTTVNIDKPCIFTILFLIFSRHMSIYLRHTYDCTRETNKKSYTDDRFIRESFWLHFAVDVILRILMKEQRVLVLLLLLLLLSSFYYSCIYRTVTVATHRRESPKLESCFSDSIRFCRLYFGVALRVSFFILSHVQLL
jgi:hypothetical protein